MPVTSQLEQAATTTHRHSALVRVTHWLTFLAFVALLVTGAEIVVSHPRFYWGEVGNVNTHPAFVLPIPASRDTVPTGYSYVMPDQNGWSRALHFQAAWLAVLVALVYGAYGIFSGHFRRNLLGGDWSWSAFRRQIAAYLHRLRPPPGQSSPYNVLQRSAYVAVIFVLFPLIIWTGLAMSPTFTSAFPATAWLLGGRQTARTIHFLDSGLLLLFLIVHVVMVAVSGFRSHLRAMTLGGQHDKEGE